MKLSELLLTIQRVAEDKGISTPYIVGGLARDKIMNRGNEFSDVDITTGDSGVHFLSKEVSIKLKPYIVSYTTMSDGHSRITMKNLDIDFSSNFKIPGIKYILEQIDLPSISEMHKELYSRDFTCNAALMTMDLKKIYDPTGLSVSDISNKKIRTCLSPSLTLGYDNRRIVRALYLSAKLDFDVDDNIINWIKENPEKLSTVDQSYVVKKINKGLSYNPKRVLDFLDKTDLWNYVPPVKELIPYMSAGRL
jgi:tRNA nucleotidyltransferase/poly(A) polymerase